MWRLIKWLAFAVIIYLVIAMIITKEDTGEVRRDDFLDRVLSHTDMLKDPRGNDPLAEMLAKGTLDSYLSASLMRACGLTLKASGDPPDTSVCRRALRYIRAASEVDTLDSGAEQLLAWLLKNLGDSRAAAIAAEKAVERLSPSDTSLIQAWLGSLYLEQGRTAEALASFRGQLTRDPENEQYYADTRHFLERSGLPRDSVEAVLSLSRVHTSLTKQVQRAWNSAITWPGRMLKKMYRSEKTEP